MNSIYAVFYVLSKANDYKSFRLIPMLALAPGRMDPEWDDYIDEGFESITSDPIDIKNVLNTLNYFRKQYSLELCNNSVYFTHNKVRYCKLKLYK